jgi:hypothetical protein
VVVGISFVIVKRYYAANFATTTTYSNNICQSDHYLEQDPKSLKNYMLAYRKTQTNDYLYTVMCGILRVY